MPLASAISNGARTVAARTVAWADGGVTPWSTDATAIASTSRTRSGVAAAAPPIALVTSIPSGSSAAAASRSAPWSRIAAR